MADDPLAGLDLIDWSALRHAYGPATDVPGLLRRLVSADPAERTAACYDLFGNIWHQGTVYEATPFAVPFLGRLLADPATPDRAAVAQLIACIADGREYYQAHSRLKCPDPFKPGETIRIGEGKEDELAREMTVVRRVRRAVRPFLPLLGPFLTHPDAGLREEVARAFALYPTQAGFTLPLLREAARAETDRRVARLLRRVVERLSC